VIKHQVAVAEVTARHHFLLLPDGLMIVQTHRQVVSDEILSTDSQIHGIPIVELIPQLLELLFGDVGTSLRIKIFAQENVIVGGNSHRFGSNSSRAR